MFRLGLSLGGRCEQEQSQRPYLISKAATRELKTSVKFVLREAILLVFVVSSALPSAFYST